MLAKLRCLDTGPRTSVTLLLCRYAWYGGWFEVLSVGMPPVLYTNMVQYASYCLIRYSMAYLNVSYIGLLAVSTLLMHNFMMNVHI